MGRSKTQVYLVDNGEAKRLIKGTLREVESKLRGEVEIRVATAEDAHGLQDVEIEDATGEPTA